MRDIKLIIHDSILQVVLTDNYDNNDISQHTYLVGMSKYNIEKLFNDKYRTALIYGLHYEFYKDNSFAKESSKISAQALYKRVYKFFEKEINTHDSNSYKLINYWISTLKSEELKQFTEQEYKIVSYVHLLIFNLFRTKQISMNIYNESIEDFFKPYSSNIKELFILLKDIDRPVIYSAEYSNLSEKNKTLYRQFNMLQDKNPKTLHCLLEDPNTAIPKKYENEKAIMDYTKRGEGIIKQRYYLQSEAVNIIDTWLDENIP